MYRIQPPSFPPKGGGSPPLEGLGEAGHSHFLSVNPLKGNLWNIFLHFSIDIDDLRST